jgi:hypothetical protein
VITNAGGGDCLFYSLDQLHPEHPGMSKVRKDVVEHLHAMVSGVSSSEHPDHVTFWPRATPAMGRASGRCC